MRAAFIELEERDSLVVMVGEHRHSIERAKLGARAEVWQQLRAVERGLWRGTDFAEPNEFQHRLQDARELLRQWDLQEIVLPVLEGWVHGVLIHDALDVPLPGFNPRVTLWHGVLTGQLCPSVLERVPVVSTWGGLGLERLHQSIVDGSLPLVTASQTRVLVGSLPSTFEDEVSRAVVSARDNGDSLEEAFLGAVEALGHLYREEEAVSVLLDELETAAREIEIELIRECTAEEFKRSLTAGSSDGTLVLIAHQDRSGVHFWDGVVSLDEVRAELTSHQGMLPWSNVLLAVCHAPDRRNLAHCLQAAGVPLVMTHGEIAFRGDSLGWLTSMLRQLEHGPKHLARLVDDTLRNQVEEARRNSP